MRRIRSYSIQELANKPTLAQGQADDLKVDTGTFRVWLSRCGPEDGVAYPVSYETRVNGRWVPSDSKGNAR